MAQNEVDKTAFARVCFSLKMKKRGLYIIMIYSKELTKIPSCLVYIQTCIYIYIMFLDDI